MEQGQGETPFPFLLAPLLNLPHSFFFLDHLVFDSTPSPSNKDFRFRAQTKYPSKRMDGLVGLNVAVFILVTYVQIIIYSLDEI